MNSTASEWLGLTHKMTPVAPAHRVVNGSRKLHTQRSSMNRSFAKTSPFFNRILSIARPLYDPFNTSGTHYVSVMDAKDKAGPTHVYLLRVAQP